METIKLEIPAKVEYVSTVRLTSSSICYQMDFDIESSEDLKVAVSEALNMVMGEDRVLIAYNKREDGMEIIVSLPDRSIVYKTDIGANMGRQILSSLVDEVEYKEDSIRIFKKKV